MIQQDYIYIGAAVLVALFIYRTLWKKSPNVALGVLILSVVAMFVFFGDWINWREYAFVTPSGRLGDQR